MTRTGRRGLAISAGLVLLGLVLVTLAARARWVTAVPVDPSSVRWLAGAGGLVLAAGGVVALVAGSGWPGLAARYERDPAAPTAATGPTSAWDAIERGDDPTR